MTDHKCFHCGEPVDDADDFQAQVEQIEILKIGLQDIVKMECSASPIARFALTAFELKGGDVSTKGE